MLVPVVFQAIPLILCDRILLSLLNGWSPSLVPLGVSAAWLEAAVRLLVLWGVRGLLSLGQTSPMSFSTVAAVSILPPLYLLVGHWLGDPPLLVSSAAWSWWLAIYGAVGFSQLLWGILAEGRSPKESRKEDKATLWKMLHLFRPDKLYLTGAFLCLVLANKTYNLQCETFLPYYIGRLIDILGTKYDAEAFSTAISLLFLISFASSVFASCRGGLFMFTISRMVIRTRNLLFSSLVRQDLAFFQEVKTGALASRLSKDTTMMSRSVPLNTNVFLRSLIKAVGLYIFMIGLSWRLTLLMLIETPLMMAVQKVYDVRHQDAWSKLVFRRLTLPLLSWSIQALLKAIQDSVARSEEVVHENLIYAYGDALSNVGAAEKVFEYLDRKPSVSTEGTLSPKSLSGCISFQNNVSFELRPGEVTALVGLNGSGKSSCVALLEHFYEPQSGEVLLDRVPVGKYEHKYLHKQVALVGQEPLLFSGSIWDNITYGLQGCSEQDASKAAKEADALGFICELEGGFTAGSKLQFLPPTLENAGLQNPPHPCSLTDGFAIPLGQQDVGDGFVLLPSIFLAYLPAEVGEKGGQLSVGQKQRLAIARALICDPKVLVLDEATSALDPESEAAIQRSVQNSGARTVLVIAHRMQTVENADKIVVLEGGEVVEEGTHTELMGWRGPYYRLVERTQAE
ncbi:hypothetical protein Chor_011698 [Crotalus horridus]